MISSRPTRRSRRRSSREEGLSPLALSAFCPRWRGGLRPIPLSVGQHGQAPTGRGNGARVSLESLPSGFDSRPATKSYRTHCLANGGAADVAGIMPLRSIHELPRYTMLATVGDA
jgi:hypothetical protein